MSAQKKTILKVVLFCMVIGLLIIAYIRYDASMYLTKEYIEEVVNQSGMYGTIVFAVIYFLVVVLFVPASAFSVLAGTLFGTVTGVLIVVIAATAAAQVSFYISRYFGHTLSEKFSKLKYIKKFATRLESEVDKNGFRAFFIMRSLFLPFIPASYAAGFIKTAKAKDFFFATLVTNAIYSPAFVFLGDQLLKGPRALILPIILIVLVLLVPRLVKKFRKKEAEQLQVE